jgi:dipeptidyl aminopeptidase/acylaminoacyl peptidase
MVLGLGSLVVVIIAGVFAAWLLGRAPGTPPPRPFESISLRRLTTQGKIRTAAISPDVKFVAYAAVEAGRQALLVRQIATSVDRMVLPFGPYFYRDVTFSPDGSYLFFVRRDFSADIVAQNLFQVSVLGGDPRKILDNVDNPVTLSPEGSRLAFVHSDPGRGEDSVMVSRIDGSDVRSLASRRWPDAYGSSRPAWSPDGKRIVVGAYAADVGGMILAAVSTDDGSEKRLGPGLWGGFSDVAWLHDGSGLLMAAADETTGWFFALARRVPGRKAREDLVRSQQLRGHECERGRAFRPDAPVGLGLEHLDGAGARSAAASTDDRRQVRRHRWAHVGWWRYHRVRDARLEHLVCRGRRHEPEAADCRPEHQHESVRASRRPPHGLLRVVAVPRRHLAHGSHGGNVRSS